MLLGSEKNFNCPFMVFCRRRNRNAGDTVAAAQMGPRLASIRKTLWSTNITELFNGLFFLPHQRIVTPPPLLHVFLFSIFMQLSYCTTGWVTPHFLMESPNVKWVNTKNFVIIKASPNHTPWVFDKTTGNISPIQHRPAQRIIKLVQRTSKPTANTIVTRDICHTLCFVLCIDDFMFSINNNLAKMTSDDPAKHFNATLHDNFYVMPVHEMSCLLARAFLLQECNMSYVRNTWVDFSTCSFPIKCPATSMESLTSCHWQRVSFQHSVIQKCQMATHNTKSNVCDVHANGHTQCPVLVNCPINLLQFSAAHRLPTSVQLNMWPTGYKGSCW